IVTSESQYDPKRQNLKSALCVKGGTHPNNPPATTSSYTLDDIWLRLNDGTAGAPSVFGAGGEPGAGPGTATGHDLNAVMAEAPVVDNTNGAIPSDVANGKTFWGLNAGDGEWAGLLSSK
ncbi:MAG: hypothetical protein GY862_30095, partial [Gammaproteobacteria bacterium]|nr:hypothetical protein [Gammaproteobacteria bacterium]